MALLTAEFLIDFGVLVFQGAVDAAAETCGEWLVVDEEVVFCGMMK